MSRGDQAITFMNDRRPYTFVILRYRHDPLAGEFVNVGVLLHEPGSGFLDAKIRSTLGPRLSKMFPNLEADSFKNSLQSIARGVKRLSDRESNDMLSVLGSAATFALRVLPNDDSSFIWGDLGSGITRDPQITLEKLYDRFVTQYDNKVRASRDDAAVWRPVRDMLVARKIADLLQSKTISSSVDEVEFEHAWKNGAWHCYQPLSFDLSSIESIREKAARWAGHMLALQESEEPFKPLFFVGAPANPSLHGAYKRAVQLLALSPGRPEVIEESAAEALVDKIEDEIRGHQSSEKFLG